MDTLVARYSRPAAMHKETYPEDQEDDLQNDMSSSLSLKFAMPPVAQVCVLSIYTFIKAGSNQTNLSPPPGSAQQPTTVQTPNAPSRSPTVPRHSPSDSKAASS